jgi:FAD synthase
MIIHEGYENLHLIAPVATLGIFDGVHRGHMALLDSLVSRSTIGKGRIRRYYLFSSSQDRYWNKTTGTFLSLQQWTKK